MSALLVAILFPLQTNSDSATPPDSQAEAADARLYAAQEVARYQFFSNDSVRRVTREPQPILHWTNHLDRRFYGDVYLWTSAGRPQVVASITNVFGTSHATETEIHSLAADSLTMQRDGNTVWTPAPSGLEFRVIPNAPEPVSSSAGRLSQLRFHARTFTASAQGSIGRWELRLLPTPVYRYASTDPMILDGAMFAFVKGTDPEVFLLLEARSTQESREWQYALARFNGNCSFRVAHDNVQVWSAERLPTRSIKDRKSPYFVLRRLVTNLQL